MHRLPIRAEKTFFSGPGYGMFHPEVICHKENAMKKFLTFLTVGLVSVFLFASAALAEEVKTDYFTLMGVISGSMTDPPAIAYSNGVAGNDLPSVGYATVYPLTMFMRVLTAQVLIIFFVS